jgi:fibrillarin-like pre-rRNA processing protein
MAVKPHKNFEGVFSVNGKIATKNLTPGEKVYGEKLVKEGKNEYRVWDYFRSKPAAAIKKGIKEFHVKKGMKILYLGIASGTTASHFSDIIGEDGIIYGVDIAERSLRDIIKHAEKRGNIITILGDARQPEKYANIVLEKVDLVYADVADPEEVVLFVRNCEQFLKPKMYGMIAVKARSIDVMKNPKQIYKETRKMLEEKFEIIDIVELDPYDKDHAMFVVRLKR